MMRCLRTKRAFARNQKIEAEGGFCKRSSDLINFFDLAARRASIEIAMAEQRCNITDGL